MTEEEISSHRRRIGAMVRERREKRGLSLRQLEEKTGIAYNHIGRIERGKYNISIDSLTRLGEALGFRPTLEDLPQP